MAAGIRVVLGITFEIFNIFTLTQPTVVFDYHKKIDLIIDINIKAVFKYYKKKNTMFFRKF